VQFIALETQPVVAALRVDAARDGCRKDELSRLGTLDRSIAVSPSEIEGIGGLPRLSIISLSLEYSNPVLELAMTDWGYQ
jgi:hypothetical protein